MSEQRTDSAADAATGADRPAGGTADTADTLETEGVGGLADAQATVERQQRSDPDLSGRLDSGSDSGSGSGGSGSGGSGSGSGGSGGGPTAETGEVSAAPSEQRREEDPGSVATEFGDRADTAPDSDVAHPNI